MSDTRSFDTMPNEIQTPPRKIRVLFLEDHPPDTELVLRELRRAEFEPEWQRVETEPGFLAALDPALDVILADYSLPQFDGLGALARLRERGLDIPFILISGTVGEEIAVNALRQGADDYLLKDRLARLGSAVAQAIKNKGLRDERRRAEAALRENEERFRQLAENIREVFWITDVAKGQMIYISPAYEAIWGRTCQSLYQSPIDWLEAIHPEDRERVLRVAATNQVVVGYDEEYRILRPDGNVRWIHDKAFPVKNAQGDVYRVVGVAEDITDRQKNERLAHRSQRLEAIGTLAGGVAHDLNNALAPIMMGVELLRMRYPAESQILNMFQTSAKRGADMVRQLLTFAKGAEGERVSLNPKHLVKEMENMIKGSFPKNIQLVVKCDPKLPTVRGEATQLHQVLLNLCVNARDAMPHGGTITLEAQCLEVDAIFDSSLPDVKPGQYVSLQVRDTGFGILPEILDRIFDPFFTTKGPDKGTGLGLSTVMGIVKGHGGFLQVHTQPGAGSTFIVYLPADGPKSDTELLAKAETEFHGCGETILFVDDETTVRDVARAVMRRLNFKPLTATDGTDGLIQASEHRTDLRAIITDLQMPHMDGLAFVRALRRMLPDIPVMVSSGRLEEHEREQFKTLGVIALLDKPFTEVQLAEALKNLLSPK